MDGSVLEHSDSDSGDSWTLLDGVPAYGDDAPDFGKIAAPHEGYTGDNTDRDEDTDGISIISDSDPESVTPSDLNYDKCVMEDNRPTEPLMPESVTLNSSPPNINDDNEDIRGEDFLGDTNNIKLKTYVHKRNKRLSTMLNIIVLGSVITAAGVAVGHIWGARNDCPVKTAPSVNKILSNLYKLQEENAYLRNKVRELSLINNIHMHHRKTDSEKITSKQHKCKKVFEESLTNKNADKLIKCVDDQKSLDNLFIDPIYEKELLNDLDKLKNVYQQNKSWLDEEIANRMKDEQSTNQYIKNKLRSPKSIKINQDRRSQKTKNLDRQMNREPPTHTETVINVTELLQAQENDPVPQVRISYADSLKSGHKVVKRDASDGNTEEKVKSIKKKKANNDKDLDLVSVNSSTDEEFRKDDRYVGPKFKPERKKNDRQKIHKKQKRRNKYEQWELKGGYMKDYEDFPPPSANDIGPDRNWQSREFERKNNIELFTDAAESGKKSEPEDKPKGEVKEETKKEKEMKWYETRAALRNAARKRLEVEMFGAGGAATGPGGGAAAAGGTGGGGAAGGAQWYFRRMQRREQCRAARDNSTLRKHARRTLHNYKTKH